MAKQDFVAGGFYGKVGNLVGQRWGNTRFVREYVVPNDPKTEAQLAWRAKFAAGIAATQIANSMDWNTPMFTKIDSPKQNQRQSACLTRLKDNVTGLDLIPLTPYDTTAPNTIADFYLLVTSEGTLYGVTTTTPPDSDITLACVIGSNSEYPSFNNCTVFKCTWNSTTGLIELPDTVTADNFTDKYIRLCSTSEDTDATTYYCSDAIAVTEWETTTITLDTLDLSFSSSQTALTVTIDNITDYTATATATISAELATIAGTVTHAATEQTLTFTSGHPVATIASECQSNTPALYEYATTTAGVTISALSIESLLYNYEIETAALTTYYSGSDVTVDTALEMTTSTTTTDGNYTLVLQSTAKGTDDNDGLILADPISWVATSNYYLGNTTSTSYALTSAYLYKADSRLYIATPAATPFPMISSYCAFPAQTSTVTANGITITLNTTSEIAYYDSTQTAIYTANLLYGGVGSTDSTPTKTGGFTASLLKTSGETSTIYLHTNLIIPDATDELAIESNAITLNIQTLTFLYGDEELTIDLTNAEYTTTIYDIDDAGSRIAVKIEGDFSISEAATYSGIGYIIAKNSSENLKLDFTNPSISVYTESTIAYAKGIVTIATDQDEADSMGE